MLYLLAQDPGASIGYLERIISGGPSLILGVLLACSLVALYLLARKHLALEQEFREETKNLLKEQLAQNEPLTAVVTTTNDSIKRMHDAIDEASRLITRQNALLDEWERKGKDS